MKPKYSNRLKRTVASLLLCCSVLFLPSARADLLVTASGESLSGSLTRIADGILVFRTSLKGQMMLPMSEVKSLSTEKEWVVKESGGAVHVGRFVPEGIAAGSAGSDQGGTTAISLTAVDSAGPVVVKGTGSTDESWTVEAGAGVRAFNGTRDGVEPSARVGVRARGERINTSLQLRFDADGEDSTPSYFSGTFDVTASGDESWAPFVQGILDRNTSEALSIRTGLTVGVRYNFQIQATGQLQAQLGLGASYGEWNRDFLNRRFLNTEGGEEEQTEANVHLGLRYSRSIWGGASWSSGFYLMPNLTDADEFRAGATSSVVYPVTSRLQLRLEMLMNYDNDPVLSSLDHVDTSVGASLEWNF